MGHEIKVLAFDTFGTVTDWHTGISQVLAEIFRNIDSSVLANEWRASYSPALAEVESGQRPWTLLDDLHREALQTILRERYAHIATAEELDQAAE